MTVRLLNSAMMPCEGTYTLTRLTPYDFGHAVAAAHRAGILVSYIGYPQTADVIRRLSGVSVPISRDQTPVEDGDVLLICRLKYRVGDPATKGERVTEDYEFFRAEYRSS